jgi:transposase
MAGKRRKYTAEFKHDAVRMLAERGLTVKEVAQNLGVDRSLLSVWRKNFNEGGKDAFPGNGRRRPDDEEMHRLKRELSQVREERDILKKALAYFAKEPR